MYIVWFFVFFRLIGVILPMNNIYKVTLGILTVLGLCFVFSSSVFAADIKTKNGFAICTYNQFQTAVTENPSTYRLETKVYMNENGKFVSNFLIYSDTSNVFANGAAPTNMRLLGANKIKNKFYKDKQWKCPNYLYLAGSTGFNMDSVYLTQKAAEDAGAKNITTMSLSEKNESNDEGAIITIDDDKIFQEGTTNTTTPGDTSADETPENNLTDVGSIKDYWNNKSGANYGNEQGDCSLIDSSMQSLLNTIFTWVSIIGIILVVLLSVLDGVKAIVGTEEGFRNFLKGLKTRIICLIVLLLAPVIVTFAIQTMNGVANIAGVNKDDPLCGVGE